MRKALVNRKTGKHIFADSGNQKPGLFGVMMIRSKAEVWSVGWGKHHSQSGHPENHLFIAIDDYDSAVRAPALYNRAHEFHESLGASFLGQKGPDLVKQLEVLLCGKRRERADRRGARRFFAPERAMPVEKGGVSDKGFWWQHGTMGKIVPRTSILIGSASLATQQNTFTSTVIVIAQRHWGGLTPWLLQRRGKTIGNQTQNHCLQFLAKSRRHGLHLEPSHTRLFIHKRGIIVLQDRHTFPPFCLDFGCLEARSSCPGQILSYKVSREKAPLHVTHPTPPDERRHGADHRAPRHQNSCSR